MINKENGLKKVQELVTRFNEHLTASNIGYKKGVEIVKETIAIYNKMESPCHPERSKGTPLSEAKELP